MRVLIFAPHADDEVLGVGGTISKYIDTGNEVFICVVTVGDSSLFDEQIIKRLRKETLEVHKFLRIEETIFLEFPSVLINEIPLFEVNKRISRVIKEVTPDVVYIPHFGDMHKDHYIVSQSVMVACRPNGYNNVKEIYSYETLSETEWNIPHVSNVFIPSTYVDISNYVERKIKAMSMYNTQLKDFPHPRSLLALESLARLRGSTIGVKSAEAFSLIRKIG